MASGGGDGELEAAVGADDGSGVKQTSRAHLAARLGHDVALENARDSNVYVLFDVNAGVGDNTGRHTRARPHNHRHWCVRARTQKSAHRRAHKPVRTHERDRTHMPSLSLSRSLTHTCVRACPGRTDWWVCGGGAARAW